ncbi:MAG TPA: DinB family protein [Anaerolineales bacterium]|nr:DinB family protein [Anaerolineales bacterium]
MNTDQVVRNQLLYLLRGGGAHMNLDQAVADFPMQHINTFPPNVPYTPWQLLEHIRLAQWDIIEFVVNPSHVSPSWPEGYWPAQDAKAIEADWFNTIQTIRQGLKQLENLVADPKTDLYAELPHAPGYTILREVLLVADHNAYHIGEFAILRQVMGTWPVDR